MRGCSPLALMEEIKGPFLVTVVCVCALRRVRQLCEKEDQTSESPSGKRASARSGNKHLFPTCSCSSRSWGKTANQVCLCSLDLCNSHTFASAISPSIFSALYFFPFPSFLYIFAPSLYLSIPLLFPKPKLSDSSPQSVSTDSVFVSLPSLSLSSHSVSLSSVRLSSFMFSA